MSSSPTFHRATADACAPTPTRGACTSDQDCVGLGEPGMPPLPPGKCVATTDGGMACDLDQCSTDADCPSDQACACTLEWPNLCVPAACRVDTDCGDGRFCMPDFSGCGPAMGPPAIDSYACSTCHDTCGESYDCSGHGSGGGSVGCGYDQDHWDCGPCPI